MHRVFGNSLELGAVRGLEPDQEVGRLVRCQLESHTRHNCIVQEQQRQPARRTHRQQMAPASLDKKSVLVEAGPQQLAVEDNLSKWRGSHA